MFRELDKGTQYFQTLRHELRAQTMPGVLWLSLLYRPVNRIATFEKHKHIIPDNAYLGNMSIIDMRVWTSVLGRDMLNKQQVFTGRHFTRGINRYDTSLAYFIDNYKRIIYDIDMAQEPQDVLRAIQRIPNISHFFSWQIFCDLAESQVIPWIGDEYVELGPGTIAAARMLIDNDLFIGRGTWDLMKVSAIRRNELNGFVHALRARQHEAFKELKLADVLLDGHQDMTLKNIEHALCEFFKYTRIELGGTGQRRKGI